MSTIPKSIQDKIIAEAKNRYIVDETHTSLGMEIQYNKRQGFNNGAIFGYQLAQSLCAEKDKMIDELETKIEHTKSIIEVVYVKGLKEQSKEIETLKARVIELETENERLKNQNENMVRRLNHNF